MTATGARGSLPSGRAADLPGARTGLALLGVTAALAALYHSVLPAWARDLWVDENYSHGVLVPFVSAWLAYDRRAVLAALPLRPAAGGLAILLAGVALLVLGRLAADLFTMRLSFVVVVAGLTVFVLGWGHARVLALPIAFLLFMVPLPAVVLNSVTLPLQFVASEIAVAALHALQLPALREGNVILLPNTTLEVVEACSGLRSLISLGAMSVIVAVIAVERPLARLVLVASSVPIAVLTNGARVAVTGVLAYYFDPSVAEGFFHGFSGWLVFLTAFLLLAGEAVVLRRLEAARG